MIILGWHGHPRPMQTMESSGFMFHDAAAVILRDGVILAAIEEERLNRVKHSNAFPARSINFCLEIAGITLRDVDFITTDCSEDIYTALVAHEVMKDSSLPRQQFREYLSAVFENAFGVNISNRMHFCKHHLAHLWNAWYPSAFPEALVVTLDGSGDGASGLIAYCEGGKLKILRQLAVHDSLGDFYRTLIGWIGYGRFDEYKVMGLAPYGDPAVFESLFRRMYQLLPEGRFTLASEDERSNIMIEAGLACRARRNGEQILDEHKHFAAGIQASLEKIVDHVIEHFHRVTGSRYLCLSGGVAHNCVMNGHLLRAGWMKKMYVQPAAHDAGNALGAALALMREKNVSVPPTILPHLFVGSHIGSEAEIGRQLSRWMPLIDAHPVENAPKTAAELLAGGAVLGWVQERSEFGPRALGNRCILADPRPAENRHRINAMVKNREDYRPFAPAVVEERLREFFEVPEGVDTVPFMITVLFVRPEMRQVLGSVTHVDGSARVQSVSRRDNPRFHALIDEFGNCTGLPIVLNTSFNNDAEPIVDSIDDAVGCFLTTGIELLVIGDWLVTKVNDVRKSSRFLDLIPVVPEHRKLVRRFNAGIGRSPFSVDSTVSRFFSKPSFPVSQKTFSLLLDDANHESIGHRIERLDLDASQVEEVIRELFELWQSRFVRLEPPR